VDHHDGRSAVVEQVFIVGRFEQRIHGDRDGPDFNGAEKCIDAFGTVGHDDRDSFLHPDAEREHRVPETVDILVKTAVGDHDVVANDRLLVRSAFLQMAVDEYGGGIQRIGEF
jgi:hypothetical protein